MSCKHILCLIFVFTLALPAGAHDVWLVEGDGEGLELVFGHPGDLGPYDPANVVSLTAVDTHGRKQQLPSDIEDGRLMVRPSTDTSIITILFDHGVWTEGPDGEIFNRSKREVARHLSASHAVKFSKTLLAWSDAARQPVNGEFEILPLADPFELTPGDELPVQILYESEPLAGAEVEILGVMDLFFTDRDGKVSLPMPEQDFQYILAYHRVVLQDDPDADELSLSTNLTFSQ